MLTDVYMDIVALRSVARETAARADAGEDVRVEASMVKYAAGEWGWRSIDKIMQIFGGMGETLDMPIPHWYHMLRHARIGGGTSEIHKFVMARAHPRRPSELPGITAHFAPMDQIPNNRTSPT